MVFKLKKRVSSLHKLMVYVDTCIKLGVHPIKGTHTNYADMFRSMDKYPYMILIVIYYKIRVKQALSKHKCDKVPFNVIMYTESLTTKLVHSMYPSDTVVYSK